MSRTRDGAGVDADSGRGLVRAYGEIQDVRTITSEFSLSQSQFPMHGSVAPYFDDNRLAISVSDGQFGILESDPSSLRYDDDIANIKTTRSKFLNPPSSHHRVRLSHPPQLSHPSYASLPYPAQPSDISLSSLPASFQQNPHPTPSSSAITSTRSSPGIVMPRSSADTTSPKCHPNPHIEPQICYLQPGETVVTLEHLQDLENTIVELKKEVTRLKTWYPAITHPEGGVWQQQGRVTGFSLLGKDGLVASDSRFREILGIDGDEGMKWTAMYVHEEDREGMELFLRGDVDLDRIGFRVRGGDDGVWKKVVGEISRLERSGARDYDDGLSKGLVVWEEYTAGVRTPPERKSKMVNTGNQKMPRSDRMDFDTGRSEISRPGQDDEGFPKIGDVKAVPDVMPNEKPFGEGGMLQRMREIEALASSGGDRKRDREEEEGEMPLKGKADGSGAKKVKVMVAASKVKAVTVSDSTGPSISSFATSSIEIVEAVDQSLSENSVGSPGPLETSTISGKHSPALKVPVSADTNAKRVVPASPPPITTSSASLASLSKQTSSSAGLLPKENSILPVETPKPILRRDSIVSYSSTNHSSSPLIPDLDDASPLTYQQSHRNYSIFDPRYVLTTVAKRLKDEATRNGCIIRLCFPVEKLLFCGSEIMAGRAVHGLIKMFLDAFGSGGGASPGGNGHVRRSPPPVSVTVEVDVLKRSELMSSMASRLRILVHCPDLDEIGMHQGGNSRAVTFPWSASARAASGSSQPHREYDVDAVRRSLQKFDVGLNHDDTEHQGVHLESPLATGAPAFCPFPFLESMTDMGVALEMASVEGLPLIELDRMIQGLSGDACSSLPLTTSSSSSPAGMPTWLGSIQSLVPSHLLSTAGSTMSGHAWFTPFNGNSGASGMGASSINNENVGPGSATAPVPQAGPSAPIRNGVGGLVGIPMPLDGTRARSGSLTAASASAPTNMPTSTPALAKRSGPATRVLVVEDNIINQTILKRILRQANVSVEVASDGYSALRLLSKQLSVSPAASSSPSLNPVLSDSLSSSLPDSSASASSPPTAIPFDLILMDVQLPGMDGLTCTRAIREMEKSAAAAAAAVSAGKILMSPAVSGDVSGSSAPMTRVTIIGVSGNATEESIQLGIQSGMDGYLVKPYAMPDILKIVNGEWESERV
ncbi:hypothetical protein HDU97_006728 [Phlyctochytrium planicorne]|nr:hypothetical protein HDU97_006728 [Phlyctochytrium planicorne]